MPTVLTCTIFMGSDEGKGWTETHHKSVDTVPGNLQTELLALKALGANAPTMRRGKITDYTTDPDGFVSFAITIDQGPALPAVGTILPFRAARLNNSKSPLNRSMIVKVDSAASVKTVVPTAAGPFVSQGSYRIKSTGFL